jgi:crotonobetainyl-CoA:carnitine CoA-transferase CaiB-like acyl-CoA transferase
MTSLDELQVLEFSDEDGAAFLGRILAERGASVFKIVPRDRPAPPDGTLAHARTLALDHAKRTFVADFDDAAVTDLVERMLAHVDVVVVGGWWLDALPAVLAPTRLAVRHEDFVLVSVLPFGARGPRARYRGSPLIASAASGLMSVTGDPERAPLRPWGRQECYLGGMLAYSGVLAALLQRRRRPAIRGVTWLDVSVQEAAILALETGFVSESYLGVTRTRQHGTNPFGYPYEVYPCEDGYVLAAIGHDWPYFAEVLGEPELDDPAFETLEGRLRNRPRLDELLRRAFARHTAEDLMAIGQAVRCPFGAVYRPSELPRLAHWQARRTFAEMSTDGGSYQLPVSSLGAVFYAERQPTRAETDNRPAARAALPGLTESETADLVRTGVITWHEPR